ncbi:MAG: SurA N-terminal domain-containing protein [Candidatus Aminicenantes bacterium]|jgi:peptidyl-prolyl cis-trans isomerase SurA
MKIKKQLILTVLTILLISSGPFFGFPEIIDKIFAVVNGEIITYSELKSAEIEMTRFLAQQYQGEELEQQVSEMKKNLLNRLIEQKLILSYAKEEDYDVDGIVELIIKDIKKQNNINTDEELKAALASQGLDYDQWKKQLKETQIQQQFIRDKIGAKINIDSSSIMEYYKENIDDYTIPAKYSLNCIFLNKENYLAPSALKEKMKTIAAELETHPFEEVAKKYSELPGEDNNYFLGEFKKGELDAKIEEASFQLKKGEHSDWIETESGYYITQLINHTESKLVEYKLVREEIENKLRMAEQEKLLKEYIEQLKKESHIKIYEEF